MSNNAINKTEITGFASFGILFLRSNIHLIQSIKEKVENRFKLGIIEVSLYKEINHLISRYDKCIILLPINSAQEYVHVLNILKERHNLILNEKLKVIVYMSIMNHEYSKSLKSYGIETVIKPTWSIKACENIFQSLLDKVNLNNLIADIKKEAVKNENLKIKWRKTLENQNDFWIINQNQNFPQKLGQWYIELIGPGPSIGHWEPIDNSKIGKETEWVFTPFDNNYNNFADMKARWCFYGKKPVFDKEIWKFHSQNPNFYLTIDNQFVYTKIKGSPFHLTLLENSEHALSKRNMIYGSHKLSQLGMNYIQHQAHDHYNFKILVKNKPLENSFGDIQLKLDVEKNSDYGNILKDEKLKKQTSKSVVRKIQSTKSKQELKTKAKKNKNIIQQFLKDPYLNSSYAKGFFKKIDKDGGIQYRILESVEFKSPVTVWLKGFIHKVEGYIDSQTHTTITIQVNDNENIDPFSKLKTTHINVFFNFSLVRGSVFTSFLSSLVKVENNKIIIPIPNDLFEVQRRKHFRIPMINKDLMIHISKDIDSLNKPLIRQIVNLSAGGLGFKIEHNDQEHFKIGMKINTIEFIIEGKKISTSAYIRNQQNLEVYDENLTVLGIEFENLDAFLSAYINAYVFENGIEYIEKFLIPSSY